MEQFIYLEKKAEMEPGKNQKGKAGKISDKKDINIFVKTQFL